MKCQSPSLFRPNLMRKGKPAETLNLLVGSFTPQVLKSQKGEVKECKRL
jgi:hypothetical protein